MNRAVWNDITGVAMRRGIFRLHALATLLASSLLCHSPAHAQQAPAPVSRALVGASVLDVETGKAIPDAVVVITGERIAAVGPAATTPIPAEARIVRVPGKWLIPGLMNMHVHLGLKLPGAAGAALIVRQILSRHCAWRPTRAARFSRA